MRLKDFIRKSPTNSGRTFLLTIKYVASYLWPVILERSSSGKGTPLYLTLESGKLLINTKDANYSYGSLQLAFEEMFDEIKYDWAHLSNVLIVGFGGGGVADYIAHQNSLIAITGIDLDPQIIAWYDQFYKNDDRVKLIHGDAEQLETLTNGLYGLVIVDVFDDLEVPAFIVEPEYLNTLKCQLQENGTLILNFVVENAGQRNSFSDLQLRLSSMFKTVTVNEQMEINRFLICTD